MIIRKANRRPQKFNRIILIVSTVAVVLLVGNLVYILKLLQEKSAGDNPVSSNVTDSLMIHSQQIIVDLPGSDSSLEPEFKFSLIINKNLNCFFENEEIKFDYLEDSLKSKLNFIENKENIAVILKCDKELNSKHLIDLMNIFIRLKVKVILAVSDSTKMIDD